MNMLEILSFGFYKAKTLKAIIVYPSKKVLMRKVDDSVNTFSIGEGALKRSFQIDEKAIYFFKKEPLLFYHSNSASPIIIDENDLDSSMSSSEFTSIIESKAVRDLLTGHEQGIFNMTIILSAISAIGVLLLLGMQSGFISFGG